MEEITAETYVEVIKQTLRDISSFEKDKKDGLEWTLVLQRENIARGGKERSGEHLGIVYLLVQLSGAASQSRVKHMEC